MKRNKKNPPGNERGFMLIALILGLLILSLLYLYSIRSVQTQVQKSGDETIDTSLQSPQQTVDSVRKRLNEQVQNEQQKLNDAEKQMNK